MIRCLHHKALAALFAGISAFTLAACGTPDEGAGTGDTSGGTAETAAAGPEPFRRIDFALPDLDGEARQLSEWDGDLVLLNFWATWCPPCKKEMPMFQERYEEYADQGFTIVAVAVDELAETKAFINTFGIEFPILIGQDDAVAAGREYGNRIGALPYTVIIDRDGLVRETHRGEVSEADLDNWLRLYL
ncbi:TlpA disulfide reductase family protein [Thioalkalivibrio sp.]|uniref:peroxiredoxin family protein n=1 Tax=Thioalkalivibrio sp. TaxID=2093813 RepID=UPI0012D65D5F|nr:TlpA disulfide reductase family protein [Thioalkalivibrio sp.]TVP81357.1 MAG: TlpA family protein disulfide reductase [Thioalkalivibrio sp.]